MIDHTALFKPLTNETDYTIQKRVVMHAIKVVLDSAKAMRIETVLLETCRLSDV
jgi:hypothetical protein